jgi:hypothetical protein
VRSVYPGKRTLPALIVVTIGLVVVAAPELSQRIPHLWNEIRQGGGYVGAMAFLLLWILAITACAAVVVLAPLSVRLIYTIGFLASCVFVDAYQLEMHAPMGATEFERALEAAGFLSQTATQFATSIGIAIALSLPLTLALIGLERWLGPRPRVRPAVLTAAVLAPLLAAAPVAAIVWVRGGSGTWGLPPPIRPLVYGAAILADNYFTRSLVRSAVTADPQNAGIRNIVYIVDESVVSDVFDPASSAHIARNIGALADLEYDFGPASSGSNCSADSNLILRFGPRPQAIQHDLAVSPSIWEYAQRAGYETIYIDMQESTNTLHNWMTAEERQHIESVILDGDAPVYLRDRFAGNALRALLASNGKHFVYINKVGAHFPWESKYPPSAAVYRPTLGISGNPYLASLAGQMGLLASQASTAGTQASKNSYRNAVQWNYNTFFGPLRDPGPLGNAVFIYTSDHGQNIYRERGNTATHCSAENTAKSEGRVPLSVFTADQKWKAVLRSAAQKNRGRVGHFNIFSSLLGFMGYDLAALALPRAPSLWSNEPSPDGLSMALNIKARFGEKPRLVAICARQFRLAASGACVPAVESGIDSDRIRLAGQR